MKKKSVTPPKEKAFSANPFAQLKGVQAVAAPEPPKPVVAPVARLRDDRDDMELFMLAMTDVARLGGASLQQPGKEKSPARPIVRKIEAGEQQLFLEALGILKLDKVFRDELPQVPVQAGVSRRARQLRRGTIIIDYELDLHGLSKEEALDALALFIGGAYRRRQQAVLVITGRGNHSPHEPVLKKAVSEWLATKGKLMVVETLAAPRQLGGDGAVVVFLKESETSGS